MTPLVELQADRDYATINLSRALGTLPSMEMVDATLCLTYGKDPYVVTA